MKKVVIIGIGQIGGSLGLLIKKKMPRVLVVGLDRSAVLKKALRKRAIDQAGRGLRSALAGADLIFIATPLEAIVPTFRKMRPYLGPGTIVLDTGSTKAGIMAEIARTGRAGRQFIGGHPLAGTERTGFEAADAGILEKAVFVLTPAGRTDVPGLARAAGTLRSLGFQVLILDAVRHDRAVALISHLPYIMAVALADLTLAVPDRELLLKLAAGSWKSATRVAASDPAWGQGVCAANRRCLAPALRDYQKILERLNRLIRRGDLAALKKAFSRAQRLKKVKN